MHSKRTNSRKHYKALTAFLITAFLTLAITAIAIPISPVSALEPTVSFSRTYQTTTTSTDFYLAIGLAPPSWFTPPYPGADPVEVANSDIAFAPVYNVFQGMTDGAFLFEDIQFGSSSEGQTYTVSSVSDDIDFDDFSAFLTNGEDEQIWEAWIWPMDPVNAGGMRCTGGRLGLFYESEVFSGTDVGTDHPGWVIQSVSLTFDNIYTVHSGDFDWLTMDYTVKIYAAPPTEVWVDDDADLSWYDATHLHIIQEGINAVAEGGTVQVAAGTYHEEVIVDKPLTLKGANAGVPGTGTRGDESIVDADDHDTEPTEAEWTACFFITSGDVTIDGFKTIDADEGVHVACAYGGDPTKWGDRKNVVVKNNYIDTSEGLPQTDIAATGIIFYNDANWHTTPTAYSVDGAVVQDNYIYQAHGKNSIWLQDVIGSVTIKGNKIDATTDGDGLCLGATSALGFHMDLSGTVIEDNELQMGGGIGIQLKRVTTSTSPVSITGNDITGAGIGVRLWSVGSETVVQGNTITDGGRGIEFGRGDMAYPVNNVRILGNNILDNDIGIRIRYVGDLGTGNEVTGNTFQDNTIQVLDNAEALDIKQVLENNFFDRAVVINHPGSSLLHVIYSYIQDAIDAALTGDTVLVHPGIYDEQVVIDKSLTVSSTDGAEVTIINAQGVPIGVLINGAETVATFEGFTVDDYDTVGILAGAFRDTLQDVPLGDDPIEVHILNNIVKPPTIEPPHNNNIQVGGGTTGTIIGNEVSGALLESLDWTGSGIIVASSNDVLVSNNYVHDSEAGIVILGYAEYQDRPAAQNNIIENNLVEDCEVGISVQANSVGTIIRYNDVLNNDVGIESMAYDLSWEHSTPAGTEIHYNNIVGNEEYGVQSIVYGDHTGGVLAEEVDATLNWWGDASGPHHPTLNTEGLGNEVSNDVDFDPWLGGGITPGGVTSEDVPGGKDDYEVDAEDEADTDVFVDTTTGSGVTVAKYADNPGADFSGGVDKYIDVHVSDPGGVSEIEIRLYYTSAEIDGLVEDDLVMLWWDSTAWVVCSDTGVTYPFGEPTYRGYIWAKIRDDTTPSLSDLGGTPFGSGTPIEVWVDDDWIGYTPGDPADGHVFGTDAFATIQNAIDAVLAGSTIHILPGTYDEQVVIDESLTLMGEGDTTIIKPSQTTADSFQLFSREAGDGDNTAPIIVASEAGVGSVTIMNLKVDGSLVSSVPSGGTRFVGILYRGTGGTIDSVIIDGIGIKGGNSIYLSPLAETVTVEVKGCTISGFLKNGITANYEGLTASIHDNTVTAGGPLGAIAQNGIQIGFGATGEIANNEVTFSAYLGEYWTATGITFVDSSGTATGNTVTDCQAGIAAQAGWYPPVSCTVTISGNTVSAAGLAAQGVPDVVGINVATWDDEASIDATIEDNDLTGGGPGNGIETGSISEYEPAGTVNAIIADNKISGWWHGVWLGLTSNEVTITSNTITNNVLPDSGVHIISGVDISAIHVNFNKIEGNIEYGVFNGGTGILDATNNWWGDDSGPFHPVTNPTTYGDRVSDHVLYEPWTGMTTYGLLRLETDPAVPTTIMLNGKRRNTWGLDWVKLESDEYTVSFTDVLGFMTPTTLEVIYPDGTHIEYHPIDEPITLYPKAAITVVIAHFEQLGNLRIETSPPVPATLYVEGVPMNDWGVWVDLEPGEYEVSFGDIGPGFITPLPITVTVMAGETTHVIVDYTTGE